MPERLDRARRYRDRAEELRTIAQEWMDADAMATLSSLAHEYERMAEDLELSATRDGLIGSPD
jgi:hypothetical protein